MYLPLPTPHLFQTHSAGASQSNDSSAADKPETLSSVEMVVVPVAFHLIHQISTLRISIPQDLRPSDNRRSVLLQLQELLRRHPAAAGGLPLLDPIEDMGIVDPELVVAARKLQDLEAELAKNAGDRSCVEKAGYSSVKLEEGRLVLYEY
jgi:superfamily II RNA helicase